MSAQLLEKALVAAAEAQRCELDDVKVHNLSTLTPGIRLKVKLVRASVAMAMSKNYGRSMRFWIVRIGKTRPGPFMAWVAEQGTRKIAACPAYQAATATIRDAHPKDVQSRATRAPQHNPDAVRENVERHITNWLSLDPTVSDAEIIYRAKRELDVGVSAVWIAKLRSAA